MVFGCYFFPDEREKGEGGRKLLSTVYYLLHIHFQLQGSLIMNLRKANMI